MILQVPWDMCILFLETTNMKDISNLGVIQSLVTGGTVCPEEHLFQEVLHWVRVQEGIFPEDLSGLAVTGQIQPFGKRAGQKRARIVIQGNRLCYHRVLHQETQGLEIKTRASDRVHWKPEAKCARGACPGTAGQALINSGEA